MSRLFKIFSKRVLKDEYCFHCGIDGQEKMLEIEPSIRINVKSILICEDCFKELR